MSLFRDMLRPAVRKAFSGYYLVKNAVWRPIVRMAFTVWNVARLKQARLEAAARRWRGRSRVLSMQAASTIYGNRRIGRAARGRDIVMLVVSDLRVDPRVEREARALAGGGYAVRVICPDPTLLLSPPMRLDWGLNVTFDILPREAGNFILSPPGFLGTDMYRRACQYRPFAFHAHDLNTCYAGLIAAHRTGAHLVADFHEWTSENVHWDDDKGAWTPYDGAWKDALRGLEARLLREASVTITVSESIVEAIALELGGGKRPALVRNIPSLSAVPTQNYPPLKQQLGLPPDSFVLLWQGGTGPTRLIEPIIEALAFAPKCTFVVRGPSLDMFGPDYMDIARRAGAEDRLILLPPVPSRDVVAAARGADAGIWTLPALCRNFTFALPNKIFEYMASELPTLVAHYPEASRMVERYHTGLVFDPYDPHSIAAAINRLIAEPGLADTLRANTAAALGELDAGQEWQRLVDIYDRLPRTGPG